jgi:hypothetical protein
MCAICRGRAVILQPLDMRSHALDTTMKPTRRLLVKDTHVGQEATWLFSLSSLSVGSSWTESPLLSISSSYNWFSLGFSTQSLRRAHRCGTHWTELGGLRNFRGSGQYGYTSMHRSHKCGVEGRQARRISRREEQWRRRRTNIMRINGTCWQTQKVKYQNLAYF